MFSYQIFIFLFLLILSFSEKFCPKYGNIGSENLKSCFDQCSPDNDQCEINKKCCFVSTPTCGHRCIVPKDDQQKSGKCPSPNCNQYDILWSTCDMHLCDVDNDCPDNRKCCSNTCNTQICLIPISRKRKHKKCFP